MKLVITRNKKYHPDGKEFLARTSNCSIMGKKEEVEFAVDFIVKNSAFISHQCPNEHIEYNQQSYDYESGFDIDHWTVPEFKEMYKKAKECFRVGNAPCLDSSPVT